jgi:hypothetical protein
MANAPAQGAALLVDQLTSGVHAGGASTLRARKVHEAVESEEETGLIMGADAIEPVGDLRGSAMALTEDLGKFGSDCCA